MENCIFCKIVRGEIPCAKIWEDEKHLAFLDLNPNVNGMTLVIPKKHFDSYTFDMPDKEHDELLNATKKVAKMLEKALEVQRVAMVMEGLGINHAHIKLYPIYYGLGEGYISTKLGPQKSMDELNKLAKEIASKGI